MEHPKAAHHLADQRIDLMMLIGAICVRDHFLDSVKSTCVECSSWDGVRTFIGIGIVIVLFFLVLAVIACCYMKRSRRANQAEVRFRDYSRTTVLESSQCLQPPCSKV